MDPDQRPSSTAIFHVLQQQASLAPLPPSSGVASPQNSLGAPTNSRWPVLFASLNRSSCACRRCLSGGACARPCSI